MGKKRKTTRVLHAHHIKSLNKFPKDRYDRSNGVVLCIKCHNSFHRKYKLEIFHIFQSFNPLNLLNLVNSIIQLSKFLICVDNLSFKNIV